MCGVENLVSVHLLKCPFWTQSAIWCLRAFTKAVWAVESCWLSRVLECNLLQDKEKEKSLSNHFNMATVGKTTQIMTCLKMLCGSFVSDLSVIVVWKAHWSELSAYWMSLYFRSLDLFSLCISTEEVLIQLRYAVHFCIALLLIFDQHTLHYTRNSCNGTLK